MNERFGESMQEFKYEPSFPTSEKKKVLVIDDEVNISNLIKLSLEDDKIEVLESFGGHESIMYSLKYRPDVIILDLMMPGYTGYDILKAIRQEPLTKNIPIIILTAKNTFFDREKALELGADEFFTKPFDVNDIKKEVVRYLN